MEKERDNETSLRTIHKRNTKPALTNKYSLFTHDQKKRKDKDQSKCDIKSSRNLNWKHKRTEHLLDPCECNLSRDCQNREEEYKDENIQYHKKKKKKKKRSRPEEDEFSSHDPYLDISKNIEEHEDANEQNIQYHKKKKKKRKSRPEENEFYSHDPYLDISKNIDELEDDNEQNIQHRKKKKKKKERKSRLEGNEFYTHNPYQDISKNVENDVKIEDIQWNAIPSQHKQKHMENDFNLKNCACCCPGDTHDGVWKHKRKEDVQDYKSICKKKKSITSEVVFCETDVCEKGFQNTGAGNGRSENENLKLLDSSCYKQDIVEKSNVKVRDEDCREIHRKKKKKKKNTEANEISLHQRGSFDCDVTQNSVEDCSFNENKIQVIDLAQRQGTKHRRTEYPSQMHKSLLSLDSSHILEDCYGTIKEKLKDCTCNKDITRKKNKKNSEVNMISPRETQNYVSDDGTLNTGDGNALNEDLNSCYGGVRHTVKKNAITNTSLLQNCDSKFYSSIGQKVRSDKTNQQDQEYNGKKIPEKKRKVSKVEKSSCDSECVVIYEFKNTPNSYCTQEEQTQAISNLSHSLKSKDEGNESSSEVLECPCVGDHTRVREKSIETNDKLQKQNKKSYPEGNGKMVKHLPVTNDDCVLLSDSDEDIQIYNFNGGNKSPNKNNSELKGKNVNLKLYVKGENRNKLTRKMLKKNKSESSQKVSQENNFLCHDKLIIDISDTEDNNSRSPGLSKNGENNAKKIECNSSHSLFPCETDIHTSSVNPNERACEMDRDFCDAKRSENVDNNCSDSSQPELSEIIDLESSSCSSVLYESNSEDESVIVECEIDVEGIDKQSSTHSQVVKEQNNRRISCASPSQTGEFDSYFYALADLKNVPPEYIEKMRNLHIFNKHVIPLSHRIEARPACKPSKEEKEMLKNFKIKKYMFLKDEDEILLGNWKRFCEEYGFEDFRPFQIATKYLNAVTRREFAQYLGQGLPERNLNQIYSRFFSLCMRSKKGVFSAEEDELIKKIVRSSCQTPYADLTKVLQRSTARIYNRYMRLVEIEKGCINFIQNPSKFHEDILKTLVKIEKCSVSDLKNRSIPNSVWQKVGDELKIRPQKLNMIWIENLHYSLFAENFVSLREMWRRIIKWLYTLQPECEQSIRWNEGVHIISGSTGRFLFNRFIHIKKHWQRDKFKSFCDFINYLHQNLEVIVRPVRETYRKRYEIYSDLSLCPIVKV